MGRDFLRRVLRYEGLLQLANSGVVNMAPAEATAGEPCCKLKQWLAYHSNEGRPTASWGVIV